MPPERSLADRLALELIEHGELPCEGLARIVRARTSLVRDALRADPRFDRVGVTRGSRWRLVPERLNTVPDRAQNGQGRTRDGMGRNLGAGARSTDGRNAPARLGALGRRPDAIEQRLADAEAPW